MGDTMRSLCPAVWLLSVSLSHSLLHNTSSPSRAPKVFSLFSIVQFPNTASTSTSSTYSNGTCLTSSECSAKSGSAQGNCAAGFGVCCIFSVSASASSISENLTYIVNPSYPSNYVPSTHTCAGPTLGTTLTSTSPTQT